MARWLVEYSPQLNRRPDDPVPGHRLPRFRIFPEGEPQRWIAETNPDLPLEVQREIALLIAESLSQLLGI
jgi:hypothetical protein